MSQQSSRAVSGTVLLTLALIASLAIGRVSAQILCYNDTEQCSNAISEPLLLGLEACCIGPGVSFSDVDGETCTLCIVFGFSQTELSALERGASYPIEVGYIKGGGGVARDVQVQVITDGTAVEGVSRDFSIDPVPTTFDFVALGVPGTIQVNYRVDSIALEPDETFRLTLTVGTGLPSGTILVDSALFTIIDDDVVEISFTEDDYRAQEPDLLIPVIVTKSSLIASDITLTVFPLTISEAENLGLDPPNVPDEFDDPILQLENSRARSTLEAQDFDPLVQIITFEADEFIPNAIAIRDIDVPITILNDSRDEPDEEVFAVFLEVTNISSVVRPEAVALTRSVSLCRIADDDPISIGFEFPDYFFAEEFAGPVRDVFLVKQDDRVTERTFLITVRAVDTAPSGVSVATLAEDYEIANVPVNATPARDILEFFFPNAQRQQITFIYFDDEIFEGPEAFQLQSAANEQGPAFSTPDGTTVFASTFIHIEDDDRAIIGYEQNYTVSELDGFVQVCLVVFSPPLDQPLVGLIIVRAGTDFGTAGPLDFTPRPVGTSDDVVLLFNNLNRRLCFSVAITPDDLYEDDEMFHLDSIPGVGFTSLDLIPQTAYVTILDASNITFGFSAESYDVIENAGFVTVTVEVLIGQLRREVIVILSTQFGTAFAGSDFTQLLDMELVFSEDVTSIDVNIPITNDGIFETVEDFLALLRFAEPQEGGFIDPETAIIRIRDDDVLVFGYVPEEYTVDEDAFSVFFEVALTGDLGEFEATVNASTVQLGFGAGFATADVDYQSVDSVDLDFNSLITGAAYGLRIFSDDITEGPEIFGGELLEYTLSRGGVPLDLAPEDSARVTLNPPNATVTINDADAATVGFLDVVYTVNETDQFVTLRIGVTSGMLGVDVSLDLSTADDTAVSPDDFTALVAQTIQLTPENPTIDVQVEIEDDQLFEDAIESFFAELSNLVVENNADVTIDPATARVDIIDNENIIIGFDPASYAVNESDGSVTLTVRVLEGQLAEDIIVRVFTLSLTARSPADFTAVDMEITFQPGDLFREFTVNITDDGALEIDEVFSAILQLVSPDPSGRIAINPPTADVTILDDDEVTIGFRPDTDTVIEGQAAMLNIVVLEGELQRLVGIQFFTTNGSAVQSSPGVVGDYADTTLLFLFSAIGTEFTVIIPTVDDSAFENTESFFGNIRFAGVPLAAVTLAPDQAEVFITDDDDITIGFSQDLYDVPEDQPFVNITVQVLGGGPLEREVTVTLDITAGTAMFGPGTEADFSPTRGQTVDLVFGPGVTEVVVPIRIIDDIRLEEDRESFFSALSLTTVEPAVTLNPASATVEIIDNDVVMIGFTLRMDTVNETVGVYTFEVVAENGANVLRRPVTVEFTTVDGSALDGSDYIAVTQTLVFDQDTTTFSIDVTILDDLINEPTESFLGRLTTTDPDVRFSIQEQTLFIVDDDEVLITFSQPSYMFIENIVTGSVVVEKIGATTQTARVEILGALQAGLAPQRIDQQLTFGPTDTQIIVDFPIQDDNIALEDIETLNFALMYTLQPEGFEFGLYPTTVVDIIDDDVLTLSVEKNNTIPEGNTVQACVQFDRPFARPFSFFANTSMTFDPVLFDATPDVDYDAFTLRQIDATLADSDAGELCFAIEVFDDGFVEEEECFTFNINLGGISDDMIDIAPGQESSTCCIIDDDRVRIGFDPTEYEVNESEGTVTLFVRVIEGLLNRTAEVSFATGDFTAIAGLDYVAVDTVLQFDSVTSVVPVVITIIDDDILEFDEIFLAALGTTDPAVDLDPDAAQVAIIEDNDEVVIGFDPDSYTVNEVEGSVVLTIRVLSGMLGIPVEVQFETTPGTATSQPPADYDATSIALLFGPDTDPAGIDVTVPIINDDIVEADETFFGTIVLSGIAPAGVTLNPDTAPVTIIEDITDVVQIGFEFTEYEAVEGEPEEVCVLLIAGTLERDVTVTVTSLDQSATAGLDYDEVDEALTFSPGDDRLCFDVVTLPDGLLENTELFDLLLNTVDTGVFLDPSAALFSITDNNTVVIGLEETSFTVTEGEDPVVEVCAVVLEGELRRDVVVSLSTSDNTARGGEDYDQESVGLIFNEDNTRRCVNITIIDDNVYEDPENFIVEITNVGPDPDVELDPDTAEILILDNNEITIGFDPDAYSVLEGNSVEVCTRLLDGLIDEGVSVGIQFETSDVTADNSATDGADYTGETTTLTFTSLDNTGPPQCVTVTTLSDDIAEGTELFEATLMLFLGVPRVTVAPDVAPIQILDEDDIIIGFIDSPYSGSEDSGFITVTVGVTSGTLDDTVIVLFATNDSSTSLVPATAGVDYEETTLPLTFNAGVMQVSFNVTIFPDGIYENDEEFLGTLDLVDSGDIDVVIAPEQATLTILDNDRVTIGLEDTVYTVNEDDMFIEVCAIVISGTLERDAVVTLSTSPGTALAGDDYTPVVNQLVFIADTDRLCTDIPITSDTIYEVDEFFNVVLTTDDDDIDLDPDAGTVTIIDVDELVIGWEQEVYSTNEMGSVELCAAVQEGTIGGPVAPIRASFTDGTATSDLDYTQIANVIFNFDVGINRLCIDVPILSDDITELFIEDFFADLSFVSGPVDRVTLDPDVARVDIIDDDEVVIGFTEPSYTGSEESGEIIVSVAVLQGTLDTDIAVQLTTQDGTATSTADYSDLLLILNFNSVDTQFNISVPVVNDAVYEFTEDLTALLAQITSNPNVDVDPDVADLFIEDNNRVTIGFERTEYSTPENSTVEVCAVIIQGSLEREVTVSVSTAPNTATGDVDYVSITDLDLTFDADTDRVCFDVEVFADDIFEGPEDFFARLTTDNPDVDLDPDEATITIVDEGVIMVRFGEPSYTFVENELSGAVEVIRIGDSDVPISVRVFGGPSITPNIVQSADPVDTIVTFQPGVNSVLVDVALTDDNVGLENVEVFDLMLAPVPGQPAVEFVAPNVTTINVLDDDDVVVGFGRQLVNVNESDGFFRMCVVKNVITVIPVTVDITSTPITATDFVDYDSSTIPTSVTIPADEFSSCFEGDIIDDLIALEPDEQFALNIVSTDPTDVTVDPAQTVINIIDDDVVTVTFEERDYTVTENVGVREVCIVKDLETTINFTASYFTTEGTAIDGLDYIGQTDSVLLGTGPGARTCFDIQILIDDINEPDETFTVTIDPFPPGSRITTGVPDVTTVTIIDTGITVNDTVIGDPLYIVPILVSQDDLDVVNNLTMFEVEDLRLCYEIHGSVDTWFNFVSDECTSVNARYTTFLESGSLNVVDEIAIRAVDDSGRCREIQISLEGECAVTLDGTPLEGTRYRQGGISIRKNDDRVRVSVPNCDELTLVMYILCENRTLVDYDNGVEREASGEMIRFDVMRGLNFGHMSAHGLIGQFWNVPVRVTPFTGVDRFGDATEDRYVIELPPRDNTQTSRTLTGYLYPLAWDFSPTPCLYVGNRQAGPIHEVIDPNDPIIESVYKDYIVPSAFDETDFPFAMFNEGRCVVIEPPTTTAIPETPAK